MQTPDPIVDEVRAARDALAKKYNYDIALIAAAIRAKEASSGHLVVTLVPRKPPGELRPGGGKIAVPQSGAAHQS